MQAKESKVINIDNNLPEGLEYFPLKGHFFDMIGIKTSDNIVFLADSIFSQETISKYHLFFVYDVREFLNSLEFIEKLDAKLYIPSHCEASENISELVEINKNKINEILDKIYNYCSKPVIFEEILKYIFDNYSLVMNANQYVLIGSTIKSYLSYLFDENRITYEFIDNKMIWKQK